MKKLMIALASAASAFGLYADVTVQNGTSFEGTPSGETMAEKLASIDTVATWTVPAAADALSFKAYGTEEIPYTPRPDQFNTGTISQESYLGIQSAFTDPAVRTIGEGGVRYKDNHLYVDSLVKFTAVDGDDTIEVTDGSAKIAIWTQEELDKDGEPSGIVNLKATAGKYVGGELQSDKAVYNLGALNNPSAWHRLTIKAVNGGNATGFVVYIDQTVRTLVYPTGEVFDPFAGVTLNPNAAAFNAAGNLIPSLAGFSGLSGLAVAGQGAIDDISFTQDKPDGFGDDFTFFTATGAENVTGFKVDGKTWVAGQGAISLVAGGSYEATEITYADGYFGITSQTLTGVAGDAKMVGDAKQAKVEVDGVPYASISDAIKAKAGAAFTIKLLQGVSENVTIANTGFVTTIDLAGQTLTGCVSYSSDLKVIDSSELLTGKMVPDTEDQTATVISGTAGKLEIVAGLFEGFVAPAADTETGAWLATITGGVFKDDNYTAETGFYLKDCVPADCNMSYANGYVTVAKLFQGSGTSTDPYQVATEADLIAVADWVADKEKKQDVYFKQTANIALTAAFDGIGQRDMKDTLGGNFDNYKASQLFKGNYDGDGKTISGVILKTGDYIGFFNSCYGATIKNLKISLGNATGWSDDAAGQVGAVFVGVSVDTTIENCETVVAGEEGAYNTFQASKTAAGFVGFASRGTVIKDCVNNLNIVSVKNEKAGGAVACGQAGTATGTAGVVIDGFTNKGNVTSGVGDKVALLVGFADIPVTLKGNIALSGTVTGTGVQSVIYVAPSGSSTLDNATITAPAGYKTVTVSNGSAASGLYFATVADGVATCVADSTAVAGTSNLKVMAAGAPVTLANINDTITLDTTLATPTVTTTATDAYVATSGTSEAQVYTVTEKAEPTITVTLDPAEAEWSSTLTFPAVNVTGATDYTTVWSPDQIEEPEAGKTNEYVVTVSVAATETTKAAEAKATFKVYKSAGQPEVKPGEVKEIEADTPEAAQEEAAKYKPVPADADAAAAGQANVLKSVAVYNETTGKYVVTAVIDETKIVDPDDTVAKAAESLSTISAAEDNAPVSVSLAGEVTPGLYYSLGVVTSLDSKDWSEGQRVLATESNKDSIAPSVNKPAGGKAFFKVMVNTMPTPAN